LEPHKFAVFVFGWCVYFCGVSTLGADKYIGFLVYAMLPAMFAYKNANFSFIVFFRLVAAVDGRFECVNSYFLM